MSIRKCCNKNPDDILPDDVKKEFGNWWQKKGPNSTIKHGDKIGLGFYEAASIIEAINDKGFATFVLEHGTPKNQ